MKERVFQVKRSEMILKIQEMMVGLPSDIDSAADSLLSRLENTGIVDKAKWESEDDHISLLEAAVLAEELGHTLRELHQLTKEDSRDQLNCGMHLMSVYEKLMSSIEAPMHPSYRKNIDEFRKTIPTLEISNEKK